MSSRLLHDTGQALFGPRWQSELARSLDVSDRTVRRWVAGTYDMPSGVTLDLWRLCEERAAALDEVIARLKAASTP